MKILSIATCFLLCLTFSCSKKSDSKPPCKLITVTDVYGSSTSTLNLSYNNDGKISTLVETGSNPLSKVYTYGNNLIFITTTSSSGDLTDSLGLNSDGSLAISVEKDASANRTVNTYTYDGSGHLLKSVYQYNSDAATTTTYGFTGGDLTSSSDGTNNASYSYFTDKAFADGDYLKLVQLLNTGAVYIKNAHLIKGFQQGSTVENFNYTFDNTGKITGVTGTSGSNIETVTYQYSCD